VPYARLEGFSEVVMREIVTRVSAFLGLVCLMAAAVEAQIASTRARNNPYSPSPDGRQKGVPIAQPETAPVVPIIPVAIAAKPEPQAGPPPVVENTVPTAVYKVGIGDVLMIGLKNVSQGLGYYTVRESGTIDFQLAGGEIVAAGKSPAAIARDISERITLFSQPHVEVSVREYGSHKITVSGLVDHPGEKSLQREAMPLFVIMAEAAVKPSASRVAITRAPLLKPEIYELNDSSAAEVLIYPGNTVEFVEGPPSRGAYFIAGNVAAPGQKELVPGQTLYQAIAAAGGAKGTMKKGLIRRKDNNGILAVLEFNLRSIRDGKTADPQLLPGDVVEVGN
jgi:polysaccharide biosynthesis/export protein